MSAHPSTTFTIRRGSPDDSAALAKLAADTFHLACPPHTSDADIEQHIATTLSVDALQRELTTDGTVFYVVELDGALVGYGMLIANSFPPSDLTCRNPVELRRMYVRGEWQGSGVSYLLMRQCIRHARTHGYDLMWLGTNQENRRAVKFYARNGFDIVGARTFTVGSSDEQDHVMARALDGELTDVPRQPSA